MHKAGLVSCALRWQRSILEGNAMLYFLVENELKKTVGTQLMNHCSQAQLQRRSTLARLCQQAVGMA